jgi:hypothetical protein
VWGKLSRGRILLLILAVYVSVASMLSLLVVKPAFYGLSTVLGTTILGTTVLGTTVLGTTILGTTVLGSTLLGTTKTTTTSLIPVLAEALSMGQLAISLIAICMLVYLELSDPSYGSTSRLIQELRKSLLPLSVVLVLLFALIVFFRIWGILT